MKVLSFLFLHNISNTTVVLLQTIFVYHYISEICKGQKPASYFGHMTFHKRISCNRRVPVEGSMLFPLYSPQLSYENRGPISVS